METFATKAGTNMHEYESSADEKRDRQTGARKKSGLISNSKNLAAIFEGATHESIPRAYLNRPSQPPRRRLLKNAVVQHVQRLPHNIKHAEIIASWSRPLDQYDHCGAPGLQDTEPVVRLRVEEISSGGDEAEGDGGVLGRDVGGARFGAIAAGGAERRDRGSIVAVIDGFEESLGERCEIVP
ncbi:MAG: hypothetical protein Q9212_001243 [Teloschistes hypoglaucus]